MQVALVEGPPQAGKISATEDLRRGADGEEKAGPCGNPAAAIPRERAAGHDAVHVHMLGEGLAPGVEDGGPAEVAAEMAGIAAEARERGGRGLKQQPVDQARVALGERVEEVREREDDVEVRNRQDLAAARGEPALGGHPLAFRAVTVPARVIGDALDATGGAHGAVAAERSRTARRDRAQGAALRAAQRVGALIRRAVGADDIGRFNPSGLLSAVARGGGGCQGHDSAAGRRGQIQGGAGGEDAARREV
jgi:hypothetical protein